MIFMRFYSFPFFVRLAHISICRLGIFFGLFLVSTFFFFLFCLFGCSGSDEGALCCLVPFTAI